MLKFNRVIQIVSASRSGSSLFKTLLAQSPSLASLAGEEEPYFKMSGNGFGLTSDSDAFKTIVNAAKFRELIDTELTSEGHDAWVHRLTMQFDGPQLHNLLDELPYMEPGEEVAWLKEQGIWGHYDGCHPSDRLPFYNFVYEMPPYVFPYSKPRITDTLLLKAPYNAYRRGVLEALFPEAQFDYIFLHRNPGATINGLIDGWQAPYGFHKHKIPSNLKRNETDGWWKFDMFPEWKQYALEPIPVIASMQWARSWEHILTDYPCLSLNVRFEELVDDPSHVVNRVCDELDIERPPHTDHLPKVMSTEPPKPGRWKARAKIIEPLLTNHQPTINALGYEDRYKWV